MKLYTPLIIKSMNAACKAYLNKLDIFGAQFIYHAAHTTKTKGSE
jgi:hypothetical protein